MELKCHEGIRYAQEKAKDEAQLKDQIEEYIRRLRVSFKEHEAEIFDKIL